MRHEHVAAFAKLAGVVLRDAALPEIRRVGGRKPRDAIESFERLLDPAGAKILDRAIHDRANVLTEAQQADDQQPHKSLIIEFGLSAVL